MKHSGGFRALGWRPVPQSPDSVCRAGRGGQSSQGKQGTQELWAPAREGETKEAEGARGPGCPRSVPYKGMAGTERQRSWVIGRSWWQGSCQSWFCWANMGEALWHGLRVQTCRFYCKLLQMVISNTNFPCLSTRKEESRLKEEAAWGRAHFCCVISFQC